MKKHLIYLLFVAFILSCNSTSKPVRIIEKIDNDWRFHLGEVPESFQANYNDESWRLLDLPHDWSIELPADSAHPSGTSGGFVKGGIGYYRKTLNIPDSHSKKRIYIKFDGIYRNSTVWVNGEKVGERPYGYVSHYYDITNVALPGEENVVVVRVDNSQQPADRWYSGCGIYRHVWLIATDPIHIPIWGTYIATPNVTKDLATVNIETEINNSVDSKQEITLMTEIFGPDGEKVGMDEKIISINSINITKAVQEFEIQHPAIWDVYQPEIYSVKSTIKKAGEIIDTYSSTFGIRGISFSADKGFEINGRQIKLKGVNLHHDGGCLGAAVPAAVWDYRLEVLKDLGVNAIRTSHNPAMEELIELCDQKGILVFNEINDKWAVPWLYWHHPEDTTFIENHKKTFYDNYLKDLSEFVDRDKNHPSVIIWSIGNETLEQLSFVEDGRKIVRNMVQWIHKNEPTRKVTAGMHPGNEEKGNEVPTSLLDDLDVLSYNYRTHQFKDWKKEYPNLICIASETKQYNNFWNKEEKDFNSLDFSNNSWWHIHEDFICGQFIWAGIDYLGESAGWPDKGLRGCMVYSNGIPKANAFFIKSLYDENPMVKIAVLDDEKVDAMNSTTTWQITWWPAPLSMHWNWTEKEGKSVKVAVFSNCETVELILNDVSLGEKKLEDASDGVLQWEVDYVPGELKAIAKKDNKNVSEDVLKTAAKPYGIMLEAFKYEIGTDNDHAGIITASIVDENNTVCPTAANEIEFIIDGPATILGVDNGDIADHYNWKGNKVKVMEGKTILIIQSTGETGKISISAKSNGLKDGFINMNINK